MPRGPGSSSGLCLQAPSALAETLACRMSYGDPKALCLVLMDAIHGGVGPWPSAARQAVGKLIHCNPITRGPGILAPRLTGRSIVTPVKPSVDGTVLRVFTSPDISADNAPIYTLN